MGCDVNLMHACMRTYGVCARILNGVNCVPIMRVYLSVCVRACMHVQKSKIVLMSQTTLALSLTDGRCG